MGDNRSCKTEREFYEKQIATAKAVLDEILEEHPELYGKIELNFQAGVFQNSNITHAGPRRAKGSM